ncbi:MAG: hypothetical protein AB1756_08835 [Acidobacteriota bacterium]
MRSNLLLRTRSLQIHLLILALVVSASTIMGFQVKQEPSRFDMLVIHDPSNIGVATLSVETLGDGNPLRAGWEFFKAEYGPGWNIYLDGRSGAPLLVEGKGIPWIQGTGNKLVGPETVTLDYLERGLREFIARNAAILMARDAELVLNREASGKLTPEVWQIIFNRAVNGIPVSGDSYLFHIVHGNLVSFGATRWGKVTATSTPSIPSDVALYQLFNYMRLEEKEPIEYLNSGDLLFVPLAANGVRRDVPYTGAIGEGYDSTLAWKFIFRVGGEPGTWVGMVDAHSGAILALYDDNKYAQVKGGVYPESDDQICPSGCEQPNYPMPFADLDVNGVNSTASSMGMFECTPTGSTARTTLNAPYVYVHDNCGSISETVTCDDDLDLRVSTGTDCVVPSGSSAGNTHASRTTFYHLNRAKEHARAYLPDNSWLKAKLTDNVNISSTCNAYWNGTVNFYKSGGGCNNTGEIVGVVIHEWGHGLDQNDGGGYDNPSEAYADISEFMYDHTSCIGRGFYQSGKCGGYGNPCLECTGIRDMDWDKRQDHQPSTPANWSDNCGGGGGPCGDEEHCEGYISGEAMWDLAARDLPANGYDQATSWQITDRIWFKSRAGSGGNAYNCSPPSSDGCGSSSWFTKLRNIDDDNGNLNDGTPHAAAIFAAFNRHNIACGNANDSSNKNYTICPSIGGTTLSASAGSGSASLSWTSVANADSYNILRNDFNCSHSFMIVATVPAPNTSYTDTGLANEFTHYYRVQPIGSNSSCLGPVSNCVDVTPQPYAGSIKFDRAKYNCNDVIQITVRDANVGSSTTTAKIWSTTESTPEVVTLTETPAGSSKFIGTINTTPWVPAADGLLSVVDMDSITGEYIDADDGAGGHDLIRQTTASVDCVGPIISSVQAKNITDTQATISWTTDQLSDSVVTWGPSKPPANEKSSSAMVTSHSIQLTGLQSCTVYYYQVSSTDDSKNKTTDDNAGQYYHFETYGNFGSGLQPCHEGRVTISKDIYSCSSTVDFQVIDMDLNPDPNVIDTATLFASSTTEADPEPVIVTETGAYTSVFTGSIQTATGSPIPDGKLQSSDGDIITVTYLDADDGTGSSRVAFDTAVTDCGGPIITDLKVIDITDQRMTIQFKTGEPGDTVVEWGSTPSLGQTITQPALTTTHSTLLNKLSMCNTFYIRVSSTDVYGNRMIADLNGIPHVTHTWDIPGLYWRETFEGDTSGWTLNGEWQIGTPQGKGGAYGNPDPNGAYNNNKAMGDDLTGMGRFPGDYEHYITETSTSQTLNANSWTGTKLILYRQLNVRFQDTASIIVMHGTKENEIYNNGGQDVVQNGYSKTSFDVGGLVDGQNQIKLRFKLSSDIESAPYDDGISSGWNIDDIIFKDGTKPDYDACGGCTVEPSFGGAKSAADNSACGATGVTISWDQAFAWGTGSSGSYTVYRDVIPSFTPSAANRIAYGITGLSYDDASAPTDQTLYYLVRAENNESCSTGPNNGGLMDDNVAYVTVTETTTWQIPEEVVTLKVKMVNHAHVRLFWEATPGATKYRIYRSTSPNGVFTLLKETDGLFYDDLNQGNNATNYYYSVRGVNPCNQEGP